MCSANNSLVDFEKLYYYTFQNFSCFAKKGGKKIAIVIDGLPSYVKDASRIIYWFSRDLKGRPAIILFTFINVKYKVRITGYELALLSLC